MVRETRSSNPTSTTATVTAPLSPTNANPNTISTTPSKDDAGSKRKRRESSPPTMSVIPNKVALPPSVTAPAPVEVTANGHENKRARMDVDGKPEVEEDGDNDVDAGVEEDEEKENGDEELGEAKKAPSRPERILNEHTREALASVIMEMATDLPGPLNKILKLHLPPTFKEVEENTLGHVLTLPDLTWESLVDTLHLFSEQLLLPCAYPNPFPSRSRIHVPITPLPSHYPPLSVYTFCESLHSLVLSIEPGADDVELDAQEERWALMQKTAPGAGGAGGEWFTAAADMEAVEAKGGLDALVSKDKLGYASPISLHTTAPRAPVPRLVESVMRRASLKAQRWKEQRLSRRYGQGFGSISRPVEPVRTTSSSISFTPSFAPSFDSTRSCGGGYERTTSAMHARARVNRWLKGWKRANSDLVGRRFSEATELGDDDDEAWAGDLEEEEDEVVEGAVEESREKGKGKAKMTLDADDRLEENAELIAELQSWQSVRIWKGDSKPSYRESLVAEQLLSNLSQLASTTPPSSLLVDSESFSAHSSAARTLPTSSPAIRGTLDPRRPHALHDNSTLRLGAQAIALAAAAAAANSASSQGQIHAPPPRGAGGAGAGMAPGVGGMGAGVGLGIAQGVMAPPPAPQIREPPPHTLPPGARHHASGMMGMGMGMGVQMHGFPGHPQGYPGRHGHPGPQSPSPSGAPRAPGMPGVPAGSNPYRQPYAGAQPGRPAGQAPSPQVSTLPPSPGMSHQQQMAQAQTQPTRPGPGPSTLRQSYGPSR